MLAEFVVDSIEPGNNNCMAFLIWYNAPKLTRVQACLILASAPDLYAACTSLRRYEKGPGIHCLRMRHLS